MKTPNFHFCSGNVELLTMFRSKSFDRVHAARIIQTIPDLNQPILDLNGYSSTYLFEAQTYNNVDAVRFLLENGSDPNLCNMDLLSWCALYDLHFLWLEMEEEADQRLEIAKLFLAFGGDPNLLIEGETLYDHVFWEVYNIKNVPHDEEYLFRFFILLLAYGGGGGKSTFKKPNLTEPIDISRINEYTVSFSLCADSHYIEGHLHNPMGIDIGTF